jgi:hypothetical protein
MPHRRCRPRAIPLALRAWLALLREFRAVFMLPPTAPPKKKDDA